MLHYLSIVQLTACKDTTGICLLNALTVYASRLGKLEEEKESFFNELFHLVSSILQNELVVLAGDMNGHVEVVIMLTMMRCLVVIGMGLGMQMAPGFWSLQTG